MDLSEKKRILGKYMSSMKKMLPRACTFLSLMTRYNELVVRAIVNKKEHLFSIPQNLEMTEADLKRLHKLIKSKCITDVEEGD